MASTDSSTLSSTTSPTVGKIPDPLPTTSIAGQQQHSQQQQAPQAKAKPIVAQDQQHMAELLNVLQGNFEPNVNVPSPKIRQIQIYLCSTHTDFQDERERFWLDVLPELQQHCLQYGTDLLLFDPFQNNEQDPVYQPHLADQLLKQIQDCRNQSEGVFFVCFLGDKYGPCPLPTILRNEEFQNIRTAAFEAGHDVKLLEEWYKINQATNPPNYELVQTSNNKNFNLKLFLKLQELLQKGAHLAHQDGLINQVNPKLQERFFTSMVEQSIQQAIEGWKQYQSNCLFILRKLEGIQLDSTNNNNILYFDVIEESMKEKTNSQLNPQEKLTKLKNFITDTIDKANVESYRITCPTGSEPSVWKRSQNWEKYLSKLSHQIVVSLKHMIDVAYSAKPGVGSNAWTKCSPITDKLLLTNHELANMYEEAWYHYQETVTRRCPKIFGHVDSLRKIRDLCREAQRKPSSPIVIHGDEGCGKSAVLSEVASNARTWLGATEVTVIVRYVTMVGAIKFLHHILRSVCMQISTIYHMDALMAAYKDVYNADRMIEWFEQCCNECSKRSGSALVVLIDDIDHMKYGHNLCGRTNGHLQQRPAWLPTVLPQNVIVVVTCSSQDQLPAKKVDPKSVVRICQSSLTETELLDIGKSVLSRYQKSITPDQQGTIKQALKSCPVPLYSVLLAHEALRWSGNQTFNGKGLPNSLSAYIDQKLTNLEKQFGLEFVTYLCSYLECALNGLTDIEILTLMSCNREVMQRLDHGSTQKLSRLPCTTWISFKNELGALVTQRYLDGKTVYSWSHSAVSNVVRNHYLNNSQQTKKCHSDMADFFNDVWSVKDCGIERATTGKLSHKSVMPQPLQTVNHMTGQIYYNRRRLKNTWYHLLHAGSVDYFEEQSLCNFDYLNALLHGCGLAHLLSVMEDMSLQVLNPELHVLLGMGIMPSLAALSCSNGLFAAEIIGRLRYTRSKNTPALNNLVDQAMGWVDNNASSPLIVPLTCWIKPPLCPLVVSFQLHDWSKVNTTIIRPTLNYQHLLVTGSGNGQISMYHIASNSLIKTFTGHTGRVLCLELSNNGQFFVTASADGTVRLWDLQQSACTKQMSLHKENVACLLLSHDDRYLITGSLDFTAKVTELATKNTVRTFAARSGAIRALTLSSHSEYLITGHSDFMLIIWNMENGEMISQVGGLMAPVANLALTSNDTFLLVASDDETLKVFSLCRGNELHDLRGHEGKVLTLAIANDDCQVFAGNTDGNIYCYDLHSGQLLSVQTCCQSSPVTSLKVTQDGHFLLSGCADNVHVWFIERPTDIRRQEDGKNFSVIAVSRDNKHVTAANFGGMIYLWDLELCQCIWITQDEPPSRVTYLLFDSEGSFLFSGAVDGSVNVWSMATGVLLKKYKGHTVAIRTIQTFSDRSRVLSHDISGSVKIWRLLRNEDEEEENDTEIQFKGTGDLMRLISDSELLAKVAESEKEIRVWNFAQEEGIMARGKMTHNDVITCLCLSRDSKFVVTGSKDQSLKIWESSTGYLTQILVGHNDEVICCVSNESFQVVVSAALDNSVYAWDVDTGTIMSGFNEPVKAVIQAVAVTADGNVGFSGYKDGWLHAWATETGQKIASFNTYLPVCEILTTPEAHRVVLRLEQCHHLAVVCLHNCPPLSETMAAKKRKKSRPLSASSSSAAGIAAGTSNAASNASVQSASANAQQSVNSGNAQITATEKRKGKNSKRLERKASKVFAPIERSRSRISLYDSPTQTGKFVERSSTEKLKSSLPANQNSSSKLCTIL